MMTHTGSSSKPKIFNDPIHGHIEISSLAVKVMDTPQFQRLRDISQLGGVYYVFPGAASNRFEHCLGVSYLAKVFVNSLRTNQPELNITDEEVLCVELAGLCHDLGHGPFSHLYDGKLLPLILKNHDFAHEHASVGILDLLIQENDLLPAFAAHGLGPQDVHFIQELMLGDQRDAPPGFQWKGRAGRSFLYDIVANKRNGIDVDKFDYFARDCHMLGLTKSFDCMRLIKFARVFPVQRSSSNSHRLEVCFHVKEAWNIFELFHTRYALHKRAYQHKVCSAVDLMLVEALYLAEPFLTVQGSGGAARRLSECVSDMTAYSRMGEYLLRVIEYSADERMAPARALLHRLRVRDLFAFCGESILSDELRAALGEGLALEAAIHTQLRDLLLTQRVSRKRKAEDEEVAEEVAEEVDLFVQIVSMGYGKGKQNPVSCGATAFYEPVKEVDEGVQGVQGRWRVGGVPEDAVSRMLPREFEEVYVRVYARHKHQCAALTAAFKQWCGNCNIISQALEPIRRAKDSFSG